MNRELITYWLTQLTNQQKLYQEELKLLPEGVLSAVKDKLGYVHYYWTVKGNDGRPERTGITKNPELRAQLARKAYLEKALKALDGNIALLHKLQAKWIPCSPQAIISTLSTSYQRVPTAEFFNKANDAPLGALTAKEAERVQAHQAWGAQPYQRSDWHSEHLTLRTTAGLYVRSKAEMLIAEQLYRYGVPFRYEQILQLGNRQYAPDFTFEAVDGSEFYLEFFGMMDNEEYAANCWSKILTYKQAGIVPWRNALYLYATGNNIDMRQVEAVIKNWIIPRM